ncbi:MAG: 30S ribosomal protein S5 [Planctomycetes bacterium]|nr:30S ribosomal protein S5 [Planctomycetota bacterium]
MVEHVTERQRAGAGGPGRGGPGRGGPGRGRRGDERDRGGRDDRAPSEFEDRVVRINRSAKVVKGGRRFSFSALVVVGDRKGRVGFGFGKANDVPSAVEKGISQAKRNLKRVPLKGRTIHHETTGRYSASMVKLVPAAPGTGVIAGASVRAVVELAGVTDILTKCYGSTNRVNLVKATLAALLDQRSREEVESLRGVQLTELK